MAAQWGLSGLSYGTSKHQFITARMEHMSQYCETLGTLVGPQQTQEILSATLVSLPEKPERNAVLGVITHMLGDTEAVAHLTGYLREMWETIDLLKNKFGEEDAQKIIYASGPALSMVAEQ
ncbi:MAG: hypothetical protein H0V70_29235 [Ktedonobacteraceae bacterium]|nr:hypothetical protein [Ktedonobacteraceae bacterium]